MYYKIDIHVLIISLTYLMSCFAALPHNVDQNGYMLYCPCMGRFGNQVDQFLGTLAFAKKLNRTLVLSPWISYVKVEPGSICIPFRNIFQVEPLQEYHRVITMDDFLKYLAPTVWPPGKRQVVCYSPRDGAQSKACNPKEGRPFAPFWDHFNIDFDGSLFYAPLDFESSGAEWQNKFPPLDYPVITFVGQPSSFPVAEENVKLHRFLEWSDTIVKQADDYIEKHIQRPFVGIHLRNNLDFERACKLLIIENKIDSMFSSPQCHGYQHELGTVTYKMCLPDKETVVEDVKFAVKEVSAKTIFVATDYDAMLYDLDTSQAKIVTRFPMDNPYMDLAILARADIAVLNCVSSFSAIVKRERDLEKKHTIFFGFLQQSSHDEL